MAGLLHDIKTFLIANGATETIFVDTTLDAPSNVITLYEYEGTSPLAQIEGSLRSIQIVVRDDSAAIAKQRIDTLYKLFMTNDSILQIVENRLVTLHLRHTPFKLKTDEQARTYYAFSMGVHTFVD